MFKAILFLPNSDHLLSSNKYFLKRTFAMEDVILNFAQWKSGDNTLVTLFDITVYFL